MLRTFELAVARGNSQFPLLAVMLPWASRTQRVINCDCYLVRTDGVADHFILSNRLLIDSVSVVSQVTETRDGGLSPSPHSLHMPDSSLSGWVGLLVFVTDSRSCRFGVIGMSRTKGRTRAISAIITIVTT